MSEVALTSLRKGRANDALDTSSLTRRLSPRGSAVPLTLQAQLAQLESNKKHATEGKTQGGKVMKHSQPYQPQFAMFGEMQGHVLKKNRRNDIWHPRYFVLRRDTLRYWHDEKEYREFERSASANFFEGAAGQSFVITSIDEDDITQGKRRPRNTNGHRHSPSDTESKGNHQHPPTKVIRGKKMFLVYVKVAKSGGSRDLVFAVEYEHERAEWYEALNKASKAPRTIPLSQRLFAGFDTVTSDGSGLLESISNRVRFADPALNDVLMKLASLGKITFLEGDSVLLYATLSETKSLSKSRPVEPKECLILTKRRFLHVKRDGMVLFDLDISQINKVIFCQPREQSLMTNAMKRIPFIGNIVQKAINVPIGVVKKIGNVVHKAGAAAVSAVGKAGAAVAEAVVGPRELDDADDNGNGDLNGDDVDGGIQMANMIAIMINGQEIGIKLSDTSPILDAFVVSVLDNLLTYRAWTERQFTITLSQRRIAWSNCMMSHIKNKVPITPTMFEQYIRMYLGSTFHLFTDVIPVSFSLKRGYHVRDGKRPELDYIGTARVGGDGNAKFANEILETPLNIPQTIQKSPSTPSSAGSSSSSSGSSSPGKTPHFFGNNRNNTNSSSHSSSPRSVSSSKGNDQAGEQSKALAPHELFWSPVDHVICLRIGKAVHVLDSRPYSHVWRRDASAASYQLYLAYYTGNLSQLWNFSKYTANRLIPKKLVKYMDKGHDQQIRTNAPNIGETVTVELWQVQRWYFAIEYSNTVLPSEPGNWVSEQCSPPKPMTREEVNSRIPLGWEWVDQWSVVIDSGDPDGWYYAMTYSPGKKDFKKTSGDSTAPLIRKRRWRRSRTYRGIPGKDTEGADALVGSASVVTKPKYVYENQRWWLGAGWTTKLLPTDRGLFTLENGQEVDLNLVEPDRGYSFSGEWMIDTHPYTATTRKRVGSDAGTEDEDESQHSVVLGETDNEGWQYAVDFPRSFHDTDACTRFVRRRRWIRMQTMEQMYDVIGYPGFASNPGLHLKQITNEQSTDCDCIYQPPPMDDLTEEEKKELIRKLKQGKTDPRLWLSLRVAATQPADRTTTMMTDNGNRNSGMGGGGSGGSTTNHDGDTLNHSPHHLIELRECVELDAAVGTQVCLQKREQTPYNYLNKWRVMNRGGMFMYYSVRPLLAEIELCDEEDDIIAMNAQHLVGLQRNNISKAAAQFLLLLRHAYMAMMSMRAQTLHRRQGKANRDPSELLELLDQVEAETPYLLQDRIPVCGPLLFTGNADIHRALLGMTSTIPLLQPPTTTGVIPSGSSTNNNTSGGNGLNAQQVIIDRNRELVKINESIRDSNAINRVLTQWFDPRSLSLSMALPSNNSSQVLPLSPIAPIGLSMGDGTNNPNNNRISGQGGISSYNASSNTDNTKLQYDEGGADHAELLGSLRVIYQYANTLLSSAFPTSTSTSSSPSSQSPASTSTSASSSSSSTNQTLPEAYVTTYRRVLGLMNQPNSDSKWIYVPSQETDNDPYKRPENSPFVALRTLLSSAFSQLNHALMLPLRVAPRVYTTFDLIWCSGEDSVRGTVSFWRPVKEGKLAALGDVVSRSRKMPTGSEPVLVEDRCDLLPPLEFKLVMVLEDGADTTLAYVWEMIPPIGYVALGCVVTTGELPNRELYRCVPEHLTIPFLSEVDSRMVRGKTPKAVRQTDRNAYNQPNDEYVGNWEFCRSRVLQPFRVNDVPNYHAIKAGDMNNNNDYGNTIVGGPTVSTLNKASSSSQKDSVPGRSRPVYASYTSETEDAESAFYVRGDYKRALSSASSVGSSHSGYETKDDNDSDIEVSRSRSRVSRYSRLSSRQTTEMHDLNYVGERSRISGSHSQGDDDYDYDSSVARRRRMLRMKKHGHKGRRGKGDGDHEGDDGSNHDSEDYFDEMSRMTMSQVSKSGDEDDEKGEGGKTDEEEEEEEEEEDGEGGKKKRGSMTFYSPYEDDDDEDSDVDGNENDHDDGDAGDDEAEVDWMGEYKADVSVLDSRMHPTTSRYNPESSLSHNKNKQVSKGDSVSSKLSQRDSKDGSAGEMEQNRRRGDEVEEEEDESSDLTLENPDDALSPSAPVLARGAADNDRKAISFSRPPSRADSKTGGSSRPSSRRNSRETDVNTPTANTSADVPSATPVLGAPTAVLPGGAIVTAPVYSRRASGEVGLDTSGVPITNRQRTISMSRSRRRSTGSGAGGDGGSHEAKSYIPRSNTEFGEAALRGLIGHPSGRAFVSHITKSSTTTDLMERWKRRTRPEILPCMQRLQMLAQPFGYSDDDDDDEAMRRNSEAALALRKLRDAKNNQGQTSSLRNKIAKHISNLFTSSSSSSPKDPKASGNTSSDEKDLPMLQYEGGDDNGAKDDDADDEAEMLSGNEGQRRGSIAVAETDAMKEHTRRMQREKIHMKRPSLVWRDEGRSYHGVLRVKTFRTVDGEYYSAEKARSKKDCQVWASLWTLPVSGLIGVGFGGFGYRERYCPPEAFRRLPFKYCSTSEDRALRIERDLKVINHVLDSMLIESWQCSRPNRLTEKELKEEAKRQEAEKARQKAEEEKRKQEIERKQLEEQDKAKKKERMKAEKEAAAAAKKAEEEARLKKQQEEEERQIQLRLAQREREKLALLDGDDESDEGPVKDLLDETDLAAKEKELRKQREKEQREKKKRKAMRRAEHAKRLEREKELQEKRRAEARNRNNEEPDFFNEYKGEEGDEGEGSMSDDANPFVIKRTIQADGGKAHDGVPTAGSSKANTDLDDDADNEDEEYDSEFDEDEDEDEDDDGLPPEDVSDSSDEDITSGDEKGDNNDNARAGSDGKDDDQSDRIGKYKFEPLPEIDWSQVCDLVFPAMRLLKGLRQVLEEQNALNLLRKQHNATVKTVTNSTGPISSSSGSNSSSSNSSSSSQVVIDAAKQREKRFDQYGETPALTSQRGSVMSLTELNLGMSAPMTTTPTAPGHVSGEPVSSPTQAQMKGYDSPSESSIINSKDGDNVDALSLNTPSNRFMHGEPLSPVGLTRILSPESTPMFGPQGGGMGPPFGLPQDGFRATFIDSGSYGTNNNSNATQNDPRGSTVSTASGADEDDDNTRTGTLVTSPGSSTDLNNLSPCYHEMIQQEFRLFSPEARKRFDQLRLHLETLIARIKDLLLENLICEAENAVATKDGNVSEVIVKFLQNHDSLFVELGQVSDGDLKRLQRILFAYGRSDLCEKYERVRRGTKFFDLMQSVSMSYIGERLDEIAADRTVDADLFNDIQGLALEDSHRTTSQTIQVLQGMSKMVVELVGVRHAAEDKPRILTEFLSAFQAGFQKIFGKTLSVETLKQTGNGEDFALVAAWIVNTWKSLQQLDSHIEVDIDDKDKIALHSNPARNQSITHNPNSPQQHDNKQKSANTTKDDGDAKGASANDDIGDDLDDSDDENETRMIKVKALKKACEDHGWTDEEWGLKALCLDLRGFYRRVYETHLNEFTLIVRRNACHQAIKLAQQELSMDGTGSIDGDGNYSSMYPQVLNQQLQDTYKLMMNSKVGYQAVVSMYLIMRAVTITYKTALLDILTGIDKYIPPLLTPQQKGGPEPFNPFYALDRIGPDTFPQRLLSSSGTSSNVPSYDNANIPTPYGPDLLIGSSNGSNDRIFRLMSLVALINNEEMHSRGRIRLNETLSQLVDKWCEEVVHDEKLDGLLDVDGKPLEPRVIWKSRKIIKRCRKDMAMSYPVVTEAAINALIKQVIIRARSKSQGMFKEEWWYHRVHHSIQGKARRSSANPSQASHAQSAVTNSNYTSSGKPHKYADTEDPSAVWIGGLRTLAEVIVSRMKSTIAPLFIKGLLYAIAGEYVEIFTNKNQRHSKFGATSTDPFSADQLTAAIMDDMKRIAHEIAFTVYHKGEGEETPKGGDVFQFESNKGKLSQSQSRQCLELLTELATSLMKKVSDRVSDKAITKEVLMYEGRIELQNTCVVIAKRLKSLREANAPVIPTLLSVYNTVLDVRKEIAGCYSNREVPVLIQKAEAKAGGAAKSTGTQAQDDVAYILVAQRARGLPAVNRDNKSSDPYLVARFLGQDKRGLITNELVKFKTDYQNETLVPIWNACFDIKPSNARQLELVNFSVFDFNLLSSNAEMCTVNLTIDQLNEAFHSARIEVVGGKRRQEELRNKNKLFEELGVIDAAPRCHWMDDKDLVLLMNNQLLKMCAKENQRVTGIATLKLPLTLTTGSSSSGSNSTNSSTSASGAGSGKGHNNQGQSTEGNGGTLEVTFIRLVKNK